MLRLIREVTAFIPALPLDCAPVSLPWNSPGAYTFTRIVMVRLAFAPSSYRSDSRGSPTAELLPTGAWVKRSYPHWRPPLTLQSCVLSCTFPQPPPSRDHGTRNFAPALHPTLRIERSGNTLHSVPSTHLTPCCTTTGEILRVSIELPIAVHWDCD